MTAVKATVNGAISIVNAIATGRGAALGISLKVDATVDVTTGTGISFNSQNLNPSSRLIKKVIEKAVPKRDLEKSRIDISLQSEIPTGYGLKSSSSISSAISLACAKIFKPKINDDEVIRDGVNASKESGVSITGAFDDACACYYGGFVVTHNYKKKIIKSEKAPTNLAAVIFIPKSRKRGNVRKLKILSNVFSEAWNLARKSNYWNSMTLNGLATSTILNSDPSIIANLIEKGALAASVSGNGPAIAAVVKKDGVSNVKKAFSSLDGTILVSDINNQKAHVHEV